METVRPGDFLILQEEPTPPGLQRLWSRRGTSTQLLEDSDFFDELFPPAQVSSFLNLISFVFHELLFYNMNYF